MKMKLKSILLIDDNEADNFLHKLVIRDAASSTSAKQKKACIRFPNSFFWILTCPG